LPWEDEMRIKDLGRVCIWQDDPPHGPACGKERVGKSLYCAQHDPLVKAAYHAQLQAKAEASAAQAAAVETRGPQVGSILDYSNLEPGVYQVASPDEVRVMEAEITLREGEHFWPVKERKQNAQGAWGDVITGLQCNTAGLSLQAEMLGVRIVPRIAEQNAQYVLAEATGFRLDTAGMLTVYRRSKEYDMAAELFRAALKKIPKATKAAPEQKPTQEQTTALATIVTEESALALVKSLPGGVQAEVLLARMEVQDHRLGLCQTKAENQVKREFIRRCGGVLKAEPGFKEMTVKLQCVVLVRKVTQEQAAAAASALFGGARRVRAEVIEPGAEGAGKADNGGGSAAQPVDAQAVPAEEPTAEQEAEDAAIVRDQGAGEEAVHEDERDEEPTPNSLPPNGQPVEDGGAGAGAGAGAPPGQPEPATGGLPMEGPVTCKDCGGGVRDNQVTFCQTARGRELFGGDIVCFKCQQKRRGKKGGAA